MWELGGHLRVGKVSNVKFCLPVVTQCMFGFKVSIQPKGFL